MIYKIILGSVLLFSSMVNAQVCQSNMPESTPTSRFTDQGDGTVLDTLTQLVWKRCNEGQNWDADNLTCTGNERGNQYTWRQALDHVKIMNANGGFAAHVDWRLPNTKELESIVSLHCSFPAINLQVFPNTSTYTSYWSSTPYAGNDVSAWAYQFARGFTEIVRKGVGEQVRLVRGG